MGKKQEFITVRVTAKFKREVERIAMAERRSLSNLCEYMLLLGKAAYFKNDVTEALRAARGKVQSGFAVRSCRHGIADESQCGECALDR